MVSDKMRTDAQTAENVMADFSFTATPVFERSSENNHSAGLANEVDGLFGEARNNPITRAAKVGFVSAIVDISPSKIRIVFQTMRGCSRKTY
jgi:radical SAM superfamily enzyme YgiQ (UPF0313 family)